MWWIVIALCAAFFTSMTTILAKIGIKDVDSNFATTYRTFIVILCSIVFCLITGTINSFMLLDSKNYLFLGLSGIATGCSWLCYYRALKMADVSKVAPIDKSSFILTSILFLIFFFNDTTNNGDALTIVMLFISIALIGIGTYFMITKKDEAKVNNKSWIVFAILSAVFASLVSLFVKMGLRNIPTEFGTLLRTAVVFVFALAIVLTRKGYKGIGKIKKKSWLFLTLSGIATGGAWFCEYIALNTVDSNPVAVNSITKLSILLTMLFSFVVLKEKFTKKSWIGLGLLTLGIIVIIIFSL